MTRGASRTSLVVMLMLGVAGPARAQVEAARWTFSASLWPTFTSDLFLIGPQGPGEVIASATLSLGYARLGPRSSFAATGWVGGQLFKRYSAYDGGQFGAGVSGQTGLDQRRARFRYWASYANGLNTVGLLATRVELPQVDTRLGSAGIGLSHDFSPSTAGDVSLDVLGIRYRADVLVESAQLPGDTLLPPDILQPVRPGSTGQGLPLAPDASLQVLGFLASEGIRTATLDYWTWRAGAGFSHEFSPRTRLSANVGYRRTYVGQSDFADGEQIEGSLGLRQSLGHATNLGFSYAYQDSRFGFRTRIHTIQAQLDKQITRKLNADVSLGASHVGLPSDVSSGWTVVGGAGLSLRLKRLMMAARYSHTRYQGLILGRSQVTDQVSASLGRAFGKRVFLSAFGYHRNAHDAQDQLYSYSDTLAGISLSIRIKKRGLLGLSYTYRRFDSGGRFPAVSASIFSVPFTYTRSWK